MMMMSPRRMTSCTKNTFRNMLMLCTLSFVYSTSSNSMETVANERNIPSTLFSAKRKQQQQRSNIRGGSSVVVATLVSLDDNKNDERIQNNIIINEEEKNNHHQEKEKQEVEQLTTTTTTYDLLMDEILLVDEEIEIQKQLIHEKCHDSSSLDDDYENCITNYMKVLYNDSSNMIVTA